MTEPTKLEYETLEVGYEFPPRGYELTREVVSRYLVAVDEGSNLYRQPDNIGALTGIVPPMAIATFAITALSQQLAFPPGSIHISQEIESLKAVSVGERIICSARVSRKQVRSNMKILSIDLIVRDRSQDLALMGKTSFISPGPNIENANKQQ